MHTIQLEIENNIYKNIMFLLNNLNLSGLKIKEDGFNNTDSVGIKQENIDFSNYQIKAFKKIDDPMQWQNEIRKEWD